MLISGPVKRVKKQYVDNTALDVPRSTMFRKRKIARIKKLEEGSQLIEIIEKPGTSMDMQTSNQTGILLLQIIALNILFVNVQNVRHEI